MNAFTITLDVDEACLALYALKELANKRAEQSLEAPTHEAAKANQAECLALWNLADRIGDMLHITPGNRPS